MNEHEQYVYWPPLRNFWDPDSEAQMEQAVAEMLNDHAKFDEPTHLVKMRRGGERLEIRAYARAGIIVYTYPRCTLLGHWPGETVEMPTMIQYDIARYTDLVSEGAFYARFCKAQDAFQDHGWTVAL